MKKVLILGANGMLGSMVTDYLSNKDDIKLNIILRNSLFDFLEKYNGNIEITKVDISGTIVFSIFDKYLKGYDYIINCIGVTKPNINENNFYNINNTIVINGILPYYLKFFCEKNNIILIQILTDCVFSGKSVNYYEENDIKDANDIYGKSKIMGEYLSDNVINLRTSIIGPEIDNSKKFLLEWFLQNNEREVEGYNNHYWNGITTLAFAKIVYGIIKKGNYKDLVDKYIHLHSFKSISKYTLLMSIKEIFEKEIEVRNTAYKEFISRKLFSAYHHKETMWLWENAGYKTMPNIDDLLIELKKYMEMDWLWKK